MKTNWNVRFLSLALILLSTCFIYAQDETGYPGDNFSMEGALDLFEKSKSLEDFEKRLNSEENSVNNLDLNEDGDIDYIRVIDNMDGNVHAIVLQVPVDKNESQDIAVIEIEKTGNETAILQIIGDEEIYGKQKIVEPFKEESVGGGKGGPSVKMGTQRVILNVWLWPSVRFIYAPRYRVWVSPFYFGFYPSWYRVRSPRPWRSFYSRTVVLKPKYRLVTTHRVVKAHRLYTPKRRTSKVVYTKTTRRVALNNGKVKGTKTTTKVGVVGNNGKATVGKRTKSTKRGIGTNGAVSKKQNNKVNVKKQKSRAVAGKKRTTTIKKRKH
ncbi:MAG: hypothetical protein P1U70_05375 [Saprospiraceae bacterium]|nr:hypothetical protein [Saprospiraceae bacterium]